MRFEHNTHCRQYQHEMLGKMRFVISAFFFLMMFSYTGELLDGSQASIRFNFVPLVQFSCSVFVYAAAYDPLDPNGNITIKWDIMSWTPDGYVVS